MSRLADVIAAIRSAPVETPNVVKIADDHVLDEHGSAHQLVPGQSYFGVQVNSLQLEAARQWAKTWDPMLVAITEFSYGTETITVPFVIGPTLLKQNPQQQLPAAMVYTNTTLVGAHPYRGGPVSLAILLFKVKRDNYLQRLLNVVETTAAAIVGGTALTQYVKIGSAVLNGIDALLGAADTVPVIGFRREFDPNTGVPFRPGTFALFSDDPVAADQLWVYQSHLWAGPQSQSAQPVTGRDQVVFTISRSTERTDARDLPAFASLVKRMVNAANVPNDESWKVAKAHLATLYEELAASPDLVAAQADQLYQGFQELALKTRNLAVQRANLAPGAVDPVTAHAAAILDL